MLLSVIVKHNYRPKFKEEYNWIFSSEIDSWRSPSDIFFFQQMQSDPFDMQNLTCLKTWGTKRSFVIADFWDKL